MSKECWIALVAACLLFACGEAAAQAFEFRRYQQAEGLASLSVTCLLQDHDGFIWVCTENGLYRYDGVEFERFGKQGIDSAAVRTAIEDAAGRLWVATSQDLYAGDGQNFKPIRPGGRALRLVAGMQLAAMPPNHLLVIHDDGLLELTGDDDAADWRSRAFFPQELLGAIPALAHLSSVFVDRLARIWLGCGSSICRVDQGAVKIFDSRLGVPDDAWRSWALDADGRLWARGQAHVVTLEAEAARFEIRDPPHARLTAELPDVPLVLDRAGHVLTSTDDGLSRWQDGWQDYAAANGVPSGISAILSDRAGQVWLGVPGHGLERWLGYDHFDSWTRAQGVGGPVWSVAAGAAHSLLLATRAGCSRLDPAASSVSSCSFDNLPAGEIRVMAQAHGALWVGMTTGGLFRIVNGEHNATWIANVPAMRKLYVDSTDQLWVGTSKGVGVIAPGAVQLQSLDLPMPPGEVADIAEDVHGAIWLASQGGLLRWSNRRWTSIHVDGEQAAAGFTTVAAAGDDWLWVGAAAHGLLHLHIAGDRTDEVHWVSDLMLTRAAMNFTRIDRRGWVWAGTDAGILVFDGQMWRRFKTSDGLTSNDMTSDGFLADFDGSVWLGTRAGLTHLKGPEALLQTPPIDLRITRVALGGSNIDARSPAFPWEPNLFLSVHMAQLNAQGNQSIMHVRLRGLRDDWFDTHGHNVYLPALGPGRYTFEAFAIDSDHRQASGLAQFSFEISPPWWRSWWFEAAATALCILLLLLAGIWRVRTRRAQRVERERQQQEHDELLERATRDALTGLWNRAAILDILAREIQTSRQLGTALAVAIVDVDHFKRINDTRGHLAGDEVLRTLGAKLNTRIRAADALGRYGGEEFLLVVPGAAKQRPFLPLERLQRAIAQIPFSYGGSPIKVTASFGVAWLQGHADTAEQLLGRADEALYSAKQAGRDRVEYAATG